MYNFFSVIGIRSEDKSILNDAEALIYDSFYVDRMSKVYIAPSEDERILAEYINFSIQISSALNFDQFKTQAQLIENKFQSRMMLPLSLSYDHRIIDGAEAARFCNDLKENLGKDFAYKLAV